MIDLKTHLSDLYYKTIHKYKVKHCSNCLGDAESCEIMKELNIYNLRASDEKTINWCCKCDGMFIEAVAVDVKGKEKKEFAIRGGLLRYSFPHGNNEYLFLVACLCKAGENQTRFHNIRPANHNPTHCYNWHRQSYLDKSLERIKNRPNPLPHPTLVGNTIKKKSFWED